MLCAFLFGRYLEATIDQCGWYWINIMIDTTVGVGIAYMFLKLTERVFGYESGNYGKGSSTGIDWAENPDYKTWFIQILVSWS